MPTGEKCKTTEFLFAFIKAQSLPGTLMCDSCFSLLKREARTNLAIATVDYKSDERWSPKNVFIDGCYWWAATSVKWIFYGVKYLLPESEKAWFPCLKGCFSGAKL